MLYVKVMLNRTKSRPQNSRIGRKGMGMSDKYCVNFCAVTLATLCAGEWEREVKGGNGGKGAAAGGEGNAGGDVPL